MKILTTFTLQNLQKLLLEIPEGKVTTYVDLAKKMGFPRASRAVGTLCGKNPEPNKYPCYKVVKSNGEVGKFSLGIKEKIQRLRRDGLEIKNGKIQNFSKYRHTFS